MAQLSISWDEHQKNVCSGLSTLQQNGEFVDMTLAADGHFVKVHQIVMVLASPYIKELISSAPCQHPVIFLNNISHSTLCNILEYIYTGESQVSPENITNVIQAAKSLHIKGLEDMGSNMYSVVNKNDFQDMEDNPLDITPGNEYSFDVNVSHENLEEDSTENIDINEDLSRNKNVVKNTNDKGKKAILQYTISNQGGLQLILNRYMYFLKYTGKNKMRQWRCVDYMAKSRKRCPAYVMTNGDVIVERVSAHIHPFHDKRILKKCASGAVFSAFQDAEQSIAEKKGNDVETFDSVEDSMKDNEEELILQDISSP